MSEVSSCRLLVSGVVGAQHQFWYVINFKALETDQVSLTGKIPTVKFNVAHAVCTHSGGHMPLN